MYIEEMGCMGVNMYCDNMVKIIVVVVITFY